MSVSDPIADLLNRIRNAQSAGHKAVVLPYSTLKDELVRILKREGFVKDFTVSEDGAKKTMQIFLKYQGDRQPVIRGLRRVSKPGLHRYVKWEKIPRVLRGMGVAILSTSAGIMTDREARKRKVGGEVICEIW